MSSHCMFHCVCAWRVRIEGCRLLQHACKAADQLCSLLLPPLHGSRHGAQVIRPTWLYSLIYPTSPEELILVIDESLVPE